jgi:hypothetical protein
MAAQSYPDGGTFLDTLKKSFTDVPVDKEKDNAVSTTEFLEAAESLTTLFGMPDTNRALEQRANRSCRCSWFSGIHTCQIRYVGQCQGRFQAGWRHGRC